ncbi:MAG: DUF4381 domain-containing protein [Alphaproteobacteria bacterium]|nr:DUF4381 domain-containing protein [Alphaproteobacteria bacterium]
MDNNLEQLRDIHLPEGVSWLPLAWGWYVVAALIIAVVLGGAFILYYRGRFRRSALKLLAQIRFDDPAAAVKISEILRRVCICKHFEAAAFSGEKWADFLKHSCSYKISAQTLQILLDAPYANKPPYRLTQDTITELNHFCRQFIGENL